MEIKKKLCPFCGEEINEGAQKCPYCHEWLVQMPPAIPTQPSTSGAAAPQDQPKRDRERWFTGTAGMCRLAAIVVMVLLILYYLGIGLIAEQHGAFHEDNEEMVMDTTSVDSAYYDTEDMPDSAAVYEDYSTSSTTDKSSMKLLATYVSSDATKGKCQYYWDVENGTLNVCTDNGDIRTTFNLRDDYDIYHMEGDDGVVTTEYNHHVYFVGYGGGCGTSWMTDNTVFYLAPLEGNDEIHVLVKECANASFTGSKVRVNYPEILNENTAKCTADYEYADHWKTIALE